MVSEIMSCGSREKIIIKNERSITSEPTFKENVNENLRQ